MDIYIIISACMYQNWRSVECSVIGMSDHVKHMLDDTWPQTFLYREKSSVDLSLLNKKNIYFYRSHYIQSLLATFEKLALQRENPKAK